MLAHEYGHTIQSVILGPLFIFVIAFPSLFWANSRKMERYRAKKGIGYYRFYPERWANHIAKRKLGRCPGREEIIS